jgi:Nnf1
VQKNVDILHQVVTEARARRQRGETQGGPDRWRADLQPRAAVRARAIPALERERDLLRARLAEVRACGATQHLKSLFQIFFFGTQTTP